MESYYATSHGKSVNSAAAAVVDHDAVIAIIAANSKAGKFVCPLPTQKKFYAKKKILNVHGNNKAQLQLYRHPPRAPGAPRPCMSRSCGVVFKFRRGGDRWQQSGTAKTAVVAAPRC